MAELLYKRSQMSKTEINDLMQILARKLTEQYDPDAEPPFNNAEHLYATIDAITYGDVPWESFKLSYNGEITEENDAPWKHKSYDIWYRNPVKVLEQQLLNRDFAEEMDFAPKILSDDNGTRRYEDFMSGRWAWRQAVRWFFAYFTVVLIHLLLGHSCQRRGESWSDVLSCRPWQ